MATLIPQYKYSTKYTVSYNGESSTRTIAGLNVRFSTSETDLGPFPATAALGSFYNGFLEFTNGETGYIGWVIEQEVEL